MSDNILELKLAAIYALLERNDVPAAAQLADAALASGLVHTVLLNLAAWSCEEAGNLHTAEVLLAQALALSPSDPLIIAAIGTVLRKQGRLAAALVQFDAALAQDPLCSVAWLERGFALEAGGSLRLALESFARSAKFDPTAAAHGGAAAVAARIGDASAGIHAAAALDLDPAHPAAHAASARLDLESGNADAAVARLQRSLAGTLTDADRCVMLELLGDAFDRLGLTSQAFAAYADAKARIASRYALAFAGAAPQRATIELIDRAVVALDLSAWTVASAVSPAPIHIFLLGYPRSGTTLVENILASAPGVIALEERATLKGGDALLAGRLDRLAAMAAPALQPYRDAYWNAVAAAGTDPHGHTVVDMDPMKGLKLPLIAKLFPKARILIMRRDPRDVVWSCFHTGFSMNATAFAFTSLEETARHYDSLMRLTEHCISALPISAHIVRYDDLVRDFDATTQEIAEFVGLEWSPEWRHFDRTARNRGVATASVGQVRRGLYNGSGQWRRYAEQLAPVMPLLQPWAERFGFD